MPPPPRQPPPSKVKFGKALAVGMVVALIWGFVQLFFGVYFRFKVGAILRHIIGDYKGEVNTMSAISPNQQNIAITGEITDTINFGGWSSMLGSLLISAAILTVLFACLGIYSGLNHNKLVLIVTVVVLVVTTFLLLGLLSLMADTDAAFHTESKQELVDLLNEQYRLDMTDSTFMFTMNALMFWFQCCGISGTRDFHNLTFIEKLDKYTYQVHNFKVAPACCVRDLYNAKDVDHKNFARIRDCAIAGYEQSEFLNNKGCYKAFYNAIQSTASTILALILIWNVLLLVLSILTIMEIKPEEEIRQSMMMKEPELERPPSEIAMVEHVKPVVKRFVPYAKISSAIQTDLTRIKSTEIW